MTTPPARPKLYHITHVDNLPDSDKDLITRTYAWDERKRQFSEHQIRLARRVLVERGWLASTNA